MKFPVLLSCLLGVVWQPVFAEETATRRIPVSPVSPTRLDVPLVIGEFVPPEPPVAKEIPAMRIESSISRQVDGKRITVVRGEPSTLPDIPRPALPEPLTQAEVAARRAFAASQPRIVFLQMQATVYDRKVSTIRWRHPQHPETGYEAVAGVDLGLFSFVTNFTHKGVPHRLMLLCSEFRNALCAVVRIEPQARNYS